MHIKVFQSTLQLLCDVRKHFVPGETSIHYQNNLLRKTEVVLTSLHLVGLSNPQITKTNEQW